MEALYKHQIEFISYMQRLLQEGDFSSTYKFAFLHSLADICIEKSVPANNKLIISLDEIVDKLLLLYWQHAKPFFQETSQSSQAGILLQNAGRQAKIISDIIQLQNVGAKNINQAKLTSLWPQVHQNTMKTLRDGPLWRLQILSKQEECYLFPHIKGRSFIELNSGIADCFRMFHDLVVQFSRQGWIEKVSKIQENQLVIGRAGELSDFLFGTSRGSLGNAISIFEEIQSGNCFYCKRPLRSNIEVDHFIPFAKYNNDLGHNFVLAHKACNNNKRDYLAAHQHKENWQEQNLVLNKELITTELSKHFTCDPDRAAFVADWAYGLADKNGSKYWLARKDVFV